MARIKLQGRAEASKRFIQLLLAEEDLTQRPLGMGLVRSEADGCGQGPPGGLELAHLHELETGLHLQVEARWMQGGRSEEVHAGLIALTAAQQQVDAGHRVGHFARLELGSSGQAVEGILELLTPRLHLSKSGPDGMIGIIQAQRALVGI